MRKSAPQPWRDASSFSLIYTLPCPVRCPHFLVSGYGALGLGGLGLCNKWLKKRRLREKMNLSWAKEEILSVQMRIILKKKLWKRKRIWNRRQNRKYVEIVSQRLICPCNKSKRTLARCCLSPRYCVERASRWGQSMYFIAVAYLFEFPEKQLRTIIFCWRSFWIDKNGFFRIMQ